MDELKRYAVDYQQMPPDYPTHAHPPEFWEALGRTVATFGFLEEALGKAIFAFTGMRQVPEENAEAEYRKWLPTLEKALTDALGSLIDAYGKAVRTHGGSTIGNFDQLLDDLRAMSGIRNALCHGSWNRKPDADGRSVPFFFNRKQEQFELALNAEVLRHLQRQVLKLTCDVINSVTYVGHRVAQIATSSRIFPTRFRSMQCGHSSGVPTPTCGSAHERRRQLR
jgi:hypothetical protein